MSENKDYDVPHSNEYPQGDLSPEVFKSKIHIFWGPDQLTESYPDYTPPDTTKWKKEQLHIPQVVRFIFNSPEAYDTQNYKDPDPPGPTERTWKLVEKKVLTFSVPAAGGGFNYYTQNYLYWFDSLSAITSSQSINDVSDGAGGIIDVMSLLTVGQKMTYPPAIAYRTTGMGFPSNDFYTIVGGYKIVFS